MFSTHRNQLEGFRSRRSMVLARRAMVCSSQALASLAGLELLRRGGNAVDAAIGAAAVLGVVEPFMTGVGGDCFMLVWNAPERRLYGLNGSGRAPAGLDLELLRQRGLSTMPMQGMLAVTVPGAVDAWCEALARFGRMPLRDVLQPAMDYARQGFPVTEVIAYQWNLLVQFGVLQDPGARRLFTIDERAPRLGEVFRIPTLADTLEEIAAGGAEVFYRGPLAERVVAACQAQGGVHTLEDFAAHRSTWVEPIATDYRGYRVCELPPNGQGLTALIALNVLENFDLAAHPLESAESLHLRIESVKLAFADRARYIADPDHTEVPTAALLSKDYAHGRAALISFDRTLKEAAPGNVGGRGDTVYLTAADADGNVVSLINSLFFPFGSGMVAGDTGIILQNRGYGFVTDPGHPNCVAPGKRPFHTIIPAMLFRDELPLVSFGVMGGDIQPQGHVQVISNLVDYGLNIQEALDYPRFRYLDSDRVALENDLGAARIRRLAALGHAIVDEQSAMALGGFWGGSDQRKDGCAIGY
jgi:gamma-glutamyltranspeptidase/glutathione hydrolase